jgi:hypothetical protein
MAEKMTKMQACGALCELQVSLQERIKYLEEGSIRNKESKHPAELSRWENEEIEKKKRWLRAIEMAGVALTR